LLTDLPIGFWTSAFVLDLVGGRRAQPAADALVGVGVAAALPTAAAGVADWSDLNEPERRSGLVHAAANMVATALYGLSFLARRRGQRLGGVMLGLAGATAATAGGFLGGHLAYRRGAGVNRAAAAPAPENWTEIQAEGTLTREKPTLARLDGEPLVAAQADGEPVALFDRCSHLAGPLHEGALVDGCVRCPWHGSTFRLADGTVVRGPATASQPAYELRVDGEGIQARRRPPS
jgi:nitrite reductase/ring-hydroxylating ferredoxin subunit